MTRLWFLRHAESSNAVGGVAGAVPRSPLTARGLVQATEVAAALAGERVAGVYTSTALRARQTAVPLGPSVELAELGEVGIGALEGSRDPVVGAETARVLHAWLVGDLDARVGDGESGAEVVARVSSALLRIVRAHPAETVAVVGHVSSLTVTLARLCGLGARVWGTPLPHAVPFLVESDGERWWCPSWPGMPPGMPPAPDFQPSDEV
jgi:alpha-ribazole phosphatase/probable phosphoglycerate mutase